MNLLIRNNISFLLLLVSLIFLRLDFKPKPADNNLNLTDTNQVIENSIQLFVSNNVYLRIQEMTGDKVSLNKPIVIINGDSADNSQICTRGKTTLKLRRKSFSFDLKEKASLSYSGKIHKFNKFYAISLSMDKHYFRNRISFGLMEEIELFELFHSYCALKINDHHEGIYMLLERPQDWALEKKHSPCIIRRGFDNKIDKLRSGKKIENKETQNNKQQFKQIYKSLNKYDGAESYTVLSQWIDLEMYMKWLAFNFYMRNGDYTDEVYFYIDSTTGKYKIIPWDYDDIFAHEPHEGTEEKLRVVGQKLIFSSEDLLDQKIASDPYLYQLYLNQLSDVLHQLTPDKIKTEMEITFAELYPYYEKYEIISMSRYDVYKDISMESLKSNLDRVYTRLIRHRMNCLDYLDKRSKNTAH